MKKTMKKLLSMVALALVGAMTVSCSSDDNIIDQAQQPVNKNNVVTLTTTVNLGDNGTRALTSKGVKTFAAGETMAIYYWKNKGNDHVKAVSAPLTEGDITNGGKSATFTFTLDNPYKDMSVSYVYPAAMANADFTPNYDALYNNQNGTLATLASNFDFCTRSGAWNGENLPSLTLENQLAILAITLKNSDGSSDITSSITGLTLSDGTNTYNVSRSAAAGPIYVAIRPTSDATITVTATDGTKNYAKTLFGKTYAKGNGYPVRWTMAKVVAYSSEMNVPAGDHWYIGGSGTHNITIGNDATVTIGSFLTMEDASIICSGNATIILADGTTTNIFNGRIQAGPEGSTLIIKGNTGELNINPGIVMGAAIGASDVACGNIVIEGGVITAKGAMAAGIGASTAACGNITISGGTVTATASDTGGAGIGSGSSDNGWCGNITISGGTVTAIGGFKSAGIGTGEENGCGNITIKSTVTSVTATKGSYAEASIGAAIDGDSYCGSVTIEDPSKVTQN